MELWQLRVIDEIKAYCYGVEAEQITLDKLKLVEHELTKVGGYKDSEPVKGGTSGREDRLCRELDNKDSLLEDLNANRQKRKLVQRCLDRMSDEEQVILKRMCCAEYGDGTSRKLGGELHMDERSIQRKWHQAMKKYRYIKSGCPLG